MIPTGKTQQLIVRQVGSSASWISQEKRKEKPVNKTSQVASVIGMGIR